MTGAAGFIGSHLIKEIYRSFDYPQVVAIDNLDGYYDLDLKRTSSSSTLYQRDTPSAESVSEPS